MVFLGKSLKKQRAETDTDYTERMTEYDHCFWNEAIEYGECMVMLRFPVNRQNLEFIRTTCAEAINSLVVLGFTPGLTINKALVNRYPTDEEFILTTVEIKTFKESKAEKADTATTYHY